MTAMVTQDAGPGEVSERNRKLMWAALLLLLLGLGLLDRGFARWRNDGRNFRQANGAYPTAEELTDAQRAALSNPAVNRAMMLAGLGALGLSVVLFGFSPVSLRRERQA